MRVQVTGRHMDVGDALRSRITEEVAAGVSKFNGRATDAIVTVGKNGGVGIEVDCIVHLSSGMTLQAQGHGV
jgi:ribosome-associated translation inhibitor RaiA